MCYKLYKDNPRAFVSNLDIFHLNLIMSLDIPSSQFNSYWIVIQFKITCCYKTATLCLYLAYSHSGHCQVQPVFLYRRRRYKIFIARFFVFFYNYLYENCQCQHRLLLRRYSYEIISDFPLTFSQKLVTFEHLGILRLCLCGLRDGNNYIYDS